MSLDLQQVSITIKKIGTSALVRKTDLDQQRTLARMLFKQYAGQPELLIEKIKNRSESDTSLRCARPETEAMDFHVLPVEVPVSVTLIAADGSQIFPDRHNAVHYGLINIGAIIYKMESGEAPIIRTQSGLLFDDQLETSNGYPLSDGMLSLKRDLEERSVLFQLSKEFSGENNQVITITDGPIELWGAREGEEGGEFEKSLKDYLSILQNTRSVGAIAAGYIDKPSADLVVRSLELSLINGSGQKDPKKEHPLGRVTDRWLFGRVNDPLLKPGERSAVFGFQSASQKFYTGDITLHFFYLNTGINEANPQISRVDIPDWVARDPEKINLLHMVLVQQCRIMGASPFPYSLHRAHECAVVTMAEKDQVDQMLSIEMRKSGIEIDVISGKQSAKNRQGRTSYK
ncbi:MAG: DNA double-strand break repair nuclease NurA [Chloroflexota bacterium]